MFIDISSGIARSTHIIQSMIFTGKSFYSLPRIPRME